jgi:hypothetical protein
VLCALIGDERIRHLGHEPPEFCSYEGIAMNRTSWLRKLTVIAPLAILASTFNPVLKAAAPGETVTVTAADLRAQADHHAQLAAWYRELAAPWSKHMITYFTMANRCERRAEEYRLAAAEAERRG